MGKITDQYLKLIVISRGLVSLGAAVTTFTLDVWIYKTTGAYAKYAVIAVLATLPPIIISPVAGYITDKVNKAKILVGCEISTFCILLLMATGYLLNHLDFIAVSTAAFLFATINEFRYTALTALIPSITTKDQLLSISGLQQIFRGLAIVAAPMLGVAGYEFLGVHFVLLISACANLYAIFATRLLISAQSVSAIDFHLSLKGFLSDYITGFVWLKEQITLKAILIHFTFINAFVSLFGVLTTPHVLDTGRTEWLAAILASQGAGLLASGLLLSRVGQSLRPENLLSIGSYSLAIFMTVFGLNHDPFVLTVLGFFIGASISFIAASNQAIWQANTPQQLQGKLIAIRSIVLYAVVPAVIYLSIPISESLISPPESPVPDGGALGVYRLQWAGLLQCFLGSTVFVISTLTFLKIRKLTIVNSASKEAK